MAGKKVAFLINSLGTGGAERVLLTIVESLKDKVDYAGLLVLEPDVFYDIPEGITPAFLGNNKRTFLISKLFGLLFFASKLKSYVNKNGIDIVQSHLFRSNYVNILAKLMGSKHIVQVVNTGAISSKYPEPSAKGMVNRWLIKKLYPRADLIIYKSKGMQQDYHKIKDFGVKEIVINNPIDKDRIEVFAKEYVEEEDLFGSAGTIVAVGRVDENKNHALLIKVFSRISDEYPGWKMIILGNGPQYKQLLRLVDSLHISNKVHLPGRVRNPFKYMAKASFFVSCSKNEGFPNALIEAMACGLPVISSDCISGPREILAPDTPLSKKLTEGYEIGEFGILFANDDSIALQESLGIFMEDSAERLKYSKLSEDRARTFSLNVISNEYKGIF